MSGRSTFSWARHLQISKPADANPAPQAHLDPPNLIGAELWLGLEGFLNTAGARLRMASAKNKSRSDIFG